MAQRVCRITEIASTKEKRGVVPASPATIWRWIAAGKFPKPFKLGPNTTVFDLDQVNAWLETRKAGVK